MAGFPVVQRSCKGVNRTSLASISSVPPVSPRHTATLASDVLRAICHADAAKFRECLRHRASGGGLGVTGWRGRTSARDRAMDPAITAGGDGPPGSAAWREPSRRAVAEASHRRRGGSQARGLPLSAQVQKDTTRHTAARRWTGVYLIGLYRYPDLGGCNTQYPDEPGAWWTEFPGGDRPAWATPSPSFLGDPAPARNGVRDTAPRRALKRRLGLTPGRRERARGEERAEWRR